MRARLILIVARHFRALLGLDLEIMCVKCHLQEAANALKAVQEAGIGLSMRDEEITIAYPGSMQEDERKRHYFAIVPYSFEIARTLQDKPPRDLDGERQIVVASLNNDPNAADRYCEESENMLRRRVRIVPADAFSLQDLIAMRAEYGMGPDEDDKNEEALGMLLFLANGDIARGRLTREEALRGLHLSFANRALNVLPMPTKTKH
jgi:hypothetical protein